MSEYLRVQRNNSRWCMLLIA